MQVSSGNAIFANNRKLLICSEFHARCDFFLVQDVSIHLPPFSLPNEKLIANLLNGEMQIA
jgi:hypothetical protein